jgi:hypothetical protein
MKGPILVWKAFFRVDIDIYVHCNWLPAKIHDTGGVFGLNVFKLGTRIFGNQFFSSTAICTNREKHLFKKLLPSSDIEH